MNSTHIKEANIENDLYYTGIAEKAYDKVVRFLSKHKDKLEGEGDDSVIHKPFIPLTQWKGVALRGTDIDKNFPSLGEVVLFFIPTKSTSRGGVTIAGGFTSKSLKVGGISFKGVIVNANLIGDYNGKYMDTRLDKDTFIHEYIHFLDHLRYRDRGLGKTSAKYLDTQDIEGYYNTPEEFNAYYQEGQSQIVRIWKNLPDDFKKKRLESYKAFQSWIIDMQFFDRDFLTYIDKKYLKKFKKRLANLYMYIQKGNIKIQEINMKSSPKSGAQVSKMLKDKGFPNVKVQKSGSYYHFVGGVANHFKEQTIHDYGLRIGDFTFEQWFKEFKEMYLGNDIPAESFSNKKIISKNNKDTKHPDMKYMKETLNEVAMNKDNVHEFIKFAKKALQLKEKVSVKLLEKRHEHMTAACYDPNTNEISIYTKGRAFADVCRSIAHEMVHQKQNELKMLEVNSGETGSDIENEANACAGIIMRNFGEIVSNLYD